MRTHLPRGATLGRAEEERGGQEQAGLGRVHSRRGPSLLPTPACGPARPSAASSRLRSSLTTPFWRLSGGEIQPGVHLCVYKSIFSFGNTYTLSFFKKQTNKTKHFTICIFLHATARMDDLRKDGRRLTPRSTFPTAVAKDVKGPRWSTFTWPLLQELRSSYQHPLVEFHYGRERLGHWRSYCSNADFKTE